MCLSEFGKSRLKVVAGRFQQNSFLCLSKAKTKQNTLSSCRVIRWLRTFADYPVNCIDDMLPWNFSDNRWEETAYGYG